MLPDLMEKYEVVILSSPGPEMDEVRERYGVKTIAVPMERHISLKHDLVSLWRMIQVFRKEKPDMVHSMTPKAGLLCMMAGWLTRVPVRVHTFTGLVFPTSKGLTRRILMLTDSITCWCATHIIPEGEGVKHDLLSNGITNKPLKILGYGNVRGIDMERFKPTIRQSPLANHQFTFLFVGRIVRDKGINELAEAFQRLSEKYKDVRLLLIGPYEDSLDPIADEARRIIRENAQIEAPGAKGGEDLISCYDTADCFVFPSYREGFPNTVLEAGAMGLPSIVTDINGSREIIISDSSPKGEGNEKLKVCTNGIIIPPRDEETLYEAMERMLTDEVMRKRMAEKARPMIASRFEQGFVRRCLYEFYEGILS